MDTNNIFKALTVVSLLAVMGLWLEGRGDVSTLTASGQGTISAKPEYVSMIVTRVAVGDRAASVIDDGEIGQLRLIDLARRLGGDGTEIKKSFYQVTPQANGTYVLANAFSIKSNKVKEATNMVKELYGNGATTVTDVVFEPMNKAEAELKAKTEAVKEAKAKAQQLAKAAGKSLGKIVSISDDDSTSGTTVSNSSQSSDTEISISKSVSIIYELK